MIAKLKLTKVTLEHNDDEIIILLGWHFVIIITRIEIINIIMEGKLQNLPKRDHAKKNGVRSGTPVFSLLHQYDFSSSKKWGTFLSPRDPWKLQLIDSLLYPQTQRSVFQSWKERIRSSMPIYPFALGIVFQLAWRLMVSSPVQNSRALSVLGLPGCSAWNPWWSQSSQLL